MIGGGNDSLIGVLHRVAAAMYSKYELLGGAFSINYDASLFFGSELEIERSRIYKTIDDFIEGELARPEEERIEAVSVLTPNFLHFEHSKKLLENGFHVICEKPLTTTYDQALELNKIHQAKEKVFAVTYTYTGYPMVRQMKQMIANGQLGKIQKVDLQYYQGWINPVLHDKDARKHTWRLNPEKAGASCCVGDIGVHAFDMLEYVLDTEVKEVLADLNTMYDDNPLDVDGTVLVRLPGNVKGVIRSSQIATGEENNFQVRIYGDKASLRWEQENPNYLYMKKDGQPDTVLKPGNPYVSEISMDGTKLPAGHPEGIFDAMGNIYKGVARAILKEPYDKMEFPTIEDGLRGMLFIEKVVASHNDGNVWKNL